MTKDELAQLAPEVQRLYIAEACGWRKGREIEPGYWIWYKGDDYHPYGQVALPAYTADLNCMAEAEKILTPAQWRVYLDHLRGQDGMTRWVVADLINVANADAPHRAKSFLLTVDVPMGQNI